MLSSFNNWCNNAVNVKIRMFVLKSQDFNYFWKSQITFGFFFQVFRPKIVNEEFIKNLSSVLSHIKSIELGETNIEGASGKGDNLL